MIIVSINTLCRACLQNSRLKARTVFFGAFRANILDRLNQKENYYRLGRSNRNKKNEIYSIAVTTTVGTTGCHFAQKSPIMYAVFPWRCHK